MPESDDNFQPLNSVWPHHYRYVWGFLDGKWHIRWDNHPSAPKAQKAISPCGLARHAMMRNSRIPNLDRICPKCEQYMYVTAAVEKLTREP